MAKKRHKHGGSDGPLDRLYTAIDEGDNRLAHELAQKILADPESPEVAKTEARKIDKSLSLDWVAIAFVGVGLVLWTIAFILGVVLRR